MLDAWWPTGDPRAALVVVVHGGFWRDGVDRTHTGEECAALAADGFVVAAIEYRRSGGAGGWPATLDDVRAALDAAPSLVAGAAPEGVAVPTDRVVLVGHSAGGHLVGWAVGGGRVPTGVVAAISLGGVLDLAVAYDLRLGDDGRSSAVEALLGGSPSDVPERYAAADPARLGAPGVPVLVLQGGRDDVVPPAVGDAYAAASGQEQLLLPDAEHMDLVDPSSAAWPEVIASVRRAAAEAGK
ncbi:lipase [Angustibacter aerolatus]|uniref:Lipase n=1 Tax=Angustibacter aerolatus TaxID=1162965 RepID=A0ABQ6JI43_9ACTN|nr:alpha/beta hydrolase [Angustibacter aerolatus]GMA86537.1 lipase [Angustibacter aerolatus]